MKMRIQSLSQYFESARKNKRFKKEYETNDLAFELGSMVYKARVLKGYTQEKLAKLISTKQSSIARLERGITLPSLSFLQRIAHALNTNLLPPRFAFLEKEVQPAGQTSFGKIVFNNVKLSTRPQEHLTVTSWSQSGSNTRKPQCVCSSWPISNFTTELHGH